MSQSNFIGDLFDCSFTRSFTVRWTKALFIVGLVLIGVQLLLSLISSLGMANLSPAAGFLWMLLSMVVALVEIIVLRVGLEVVSVLFRIEEHARHLANDETNVVIAARDDLAVHKGSVTNTKNATESAPDGPVSLTKAHLGRCSARFLTQRHLRSMCNRCSQHCANPAARVLYGDLYGV